MNDLPCFVIIKCFFSPSGGQPHCILEMFEFFPLQVWLGLFIKTRVLQQTAETWMVFVYFDTNEDYISLYQSRLYRQNKENLRKTSSDRKWHNLREKASLLASPSSSVQLLQMLRHWINQISQLIVELSKDFFCKMCVPPLHSLHMLHKNDEDGSW